MPASTAGKALPYPLGTDRVMDGDDQIRKLAQSVDNMVQTGSATVPITAAGTAASVVVTFPVAFASAPTVVVAVGGAGSGLMSASPLTATSNASPTQVTIWGIRATGTATFSVNYVAVGPVVAVT